MIIDSTIYYVELTTGWVDLKENLGYYHDKEGKLGIEEISKTEFLPNFQLYSPDLLPNKNWDTYWLVLQLENKMDEKARIAVFSFANKTIVYSQRSGSITNVDTSGFNYPISTWPAIKAIPSVYDAYTIPIEILPFEKVNLYFKVNPHFYYEYDDQSLNVFSWESYLRYDIFYINRLIRWQALYQGMLFMILLFNLLIFFNSRDLTYLFYSLYVASIAYYFLVIMGYDRLWIWGENVPFMPIGQNISVYGVGIFYPLFTIYFLHKDGWKPKLKKMLMYLVYFAIINALISSLIILTMSPVDPKANYWMNILFIPTGILGTGLFLYVNVIYLISKSRLAKFFAMAGLTMFIGVFLSVFSSILQSLNLMASLNLEYLQDIPSAYIFEIGCLVQILMFALALSYRSRLIEKEKATLEELDNTKTRFFANISHEFKTPLTLILGPASDLLKKTKDTHSNQMLSVIQQNARRLLSLINEIMDLSKLDAGKMPMTIQKKDLVAFSRKLVHQFESYSESKNIKLNFRSNEQELILGIDLDKMEKVLTNLLSNALKFTPNGGLVNLTIEKEKKRAVLTVSDTGIGIPEDHIPHLFDRFYQANQKDYTTDQPSTGIGLALTKELIELHQGTIIVKSTMGKGSKFIVQLPMDLKESESLESSEAIIKQVESKEESLILTNGVTNTVGDLPEILIIEDNPELRSYIRSCLSSFYQVLEAENGKAGHDLAIEKIPNLIITDVMMPKMDGFSVSRELKQNEKTSHIPIIILTGKSSQQSRLEGLETHADVYLSKPFDTDELLLQVRNLLSNRKRMQEFYSERILLETSELEVSSQEEVFLKKAISVVEDQIGNEDFNIEDFSRALAMDRTQLFRKLKALTDQSPSIFIRNLRLKRARQMLEGNAGTVSEIAFAVGFKSNSYFIKCFKELFGESPGSIKT